MYRLMYHLSVADILVALLNILPQLIWDVTYRQDTLSTIRKEGGREEEPIILPAAKKNRQVFSSIIFLLFNFAERHPSIQFVT